MDWFLSLPVFLQALLASLFTYGMTALGGTVVFFAAKLPKRFLTLMTGCAAGIMIAASFFSLLLPANIVRSHPISSTAPDLGNDQNNGIETTSAGTLHHF